MCVCFLFLHLDTYCILLYLLVVSCSSVRRILANPCLVPGVVMTLSLQIFHRVANWLLWLPVGRAPGRTQRLCNSHDDLSVTSHFCHACKRSLLMLLNILLTRWLEHSCNCLLSGDTGQCSTLLQLLRHATIWRHSISGCRPCCLIMFHLFHLQCFMFLLLLHVGFVRAPCMPSRTGFREACSIPKINGRMI